MVVIVRSALRSDCSDDACDGTFLWPTSKTPSEISARPPSTSLIIMVVGTTIRATGCASCRVSLLRTFTSIGAFPARHVPKRLPLASAPRARLISQQYTDYGANYQGDVEYSPPEPEVLREEPTEEGEPSEVEAAETAIEASTLPWYLQDKSSEKTIQPEPRIPKLNNMPPPILRPLLMNLAVDQGLDDLSIIDLRKLDPPPALGANLLMILGTARSEKHLHMSADRFCRWLRSTYKIHPDADGLIGRNELKIKLKRKSKRAKLLGLGTTNPDDTNDDGIRTGWVCVDVGIVKGMKGVDVVTPNPKAFVGFGRRTDGTRIVVQMMTEEKREEIDLEKLWGGILKRSEKGMDSEENLDNEYISSPPPMPTPTLYKYNDSPIKTQTRGLHTSARRMVTHDESREHEREWSSSIAHQTSGQVEGTAKWKASEPQPLKETPKFPGKNVGSAAHQARMKAQWIAAGSRTPEDKAAERERKRLEYEANQARSRAAWIAAGSPVREKKFPVPDIKLPKDVMHTIRFQASQLRKKNLASQSQK